jgi:hypothetical protein
MSFLDALFLDPATFHVWIADRADHQRGAGTVSDPYHGGLNNSGVGQFDTIMNLPQVAQPYAVIHLGPGTFQTKGYSDDGNGGWRLQRGMKILGSGIDVTTLRLTGVAPTSGQRYYAVGHPLPTSTAELLDGAEVQDLTVDCNLAGANANAACGAIRVMGNNARVRRVKVQGFGTNKAGLTAYVVSVVTACENASGVFEAANAGIEDCYAMLPGTSVATGQVVIFNTGGPDDTVPTKLELQGKSPFIRNCYVDCGVATPSLTSPMFFALSLSACRGGVAEGNQIYNTDVGGPYQATRSVRDLAVRNNFYKNVARGPFVSLGRQGANLASGSPSISWTSGVGHVTAGTSDLSSLGNGDRVLITATPSDPTVDGIYIIQNVTPTAFDVVTTTPYPRPAFLGLISKIIGAGRVIVEGNVIELVAVDGVGAPVPALAASFRDDVTGTPPSPEAPDYPIGDLIIRNNKIRYVDGRFSSSYLGYASEVVGAKNLQVQNNVIDCAPANPVRNARTGAATYFNNLTPKGGLVLGFKSDAPTRTYDELQTQADDALILAFAEVG